jgi:hypothetical protein
MFAPAADLILYGDCVDLTRVLGNMRRWMYIIAANLSLGVPISWLWGRRIFEKQNRHAYRS